MKSNFQLWLLSALMVLCGALFAPVAIAAEAHGEAAHLAEGQAGDHHAATSQTSVLDLMGSLMFWEYVTFGLVLVILGFGVFPKLYAQLDKRQSSIREALDKADQVRAEAEVLLKKHEDLMRRANDDAKKVTDEAVNAGRQARERIESAAQQAAAEIKVRAEKEVELLTRKAEAELREKAIDLALEAASKVLGRSLTGEDHRKLARESIERAGAMRN
jgi:F-type H+-transporting ATPase subunit b